MTENEFHSTDGDQNVAQGDGAVGKQENVTQELRGNGNVSAGTGNVTVNHGLQVRPRMVVLASLLAAGVLGVVLAGWYLLAPISPPVPVTNTISTTGGSAPATVAGRDVAVNHNNSGVTPETFAHYAGELAVTDSALTSFFKILEEQQVPRSDLDAKLREIAATHKELLARLATVQSEDPEVQRLKQEARQTIEAGDYAKAEELLSQAEALDLAAIEEMEQAAKQRRISAAATNADQARLQRVQLRYAKAVEYWQKAAALLPDEEKKDRAYYLNKAGYDLDNISRYSEALPLYEESLDIRREIGDRDGEGSTLNNISQIYHNWGDYDTALKYLEQSLAICQEIGDGDGAACALNNISQIYHDRGDIDTALKYLKQSLTICQKIDNRAGEGAILTNIGRIYNARGEYDTALKYQEQSLTICQEIGDKKVEGSTLNNIGLIYDARGDNTKALQYYEQSLAIRQEIGDRRGDAETSWNIGRLHEDQSDLAKAEQYISWAVQLAEAIGHPLLEKWRKALEDLRAKIKEQ